MRAVRNLLAGVAAAIMLAFSVPAMAGGHDWDDDYGYHGHRNWGWHYGHDTHRYVHHHVYAAPRYVHVYHVYRPAPRFVHVIGYQHAATRRTGSPIRITTAITGQPPTTARTTR